MVLRPDFKGGEKETLASIARIEERVKKLNETLSQGTSKAGGRTRSPRIKEEEDAAKEIARINADTRRQAEQQARFRAAVEKRGADAAISEERRVEKERKRVANEFLRNLQEQRRQQEQASRGGIGLAGIAGAVGLGNLGARAISEITSLVADGTRAWIDYAAKLQTSRIAFTTMLGSAQAAEVHLKELQQFALKTPFQFAELIDASQRMQALGFKAKEVIPILTDVGNAVAASGGGAERLERIIKALSDVRSKEKLQSQEIRQFAEAGIDALKILENATGKSIAQITKDVEAGAISADFFIESFRKFSQVNFGGLMEAQSRTFLGALSNIKDGLLQLAGEAFEPTFNDLTRRLIEVADSLQNNKDQWSVWFASIKDAATIMWEVVSPILKGTVAVLNDIKYAMDLSKQASDFVTQAFGGRPQYKQGAFNLSQVGASNLLPSANAQDVSGGANRVQQEVESNKVKQKANDILTDLIAKLASYGDSSVVAATKQKLLKSGMTDLNNEYAKMALHIASVIDARVREAELASDEQQRIFNRSQQISQQLEQAASSANAQVFELTTTSRAGQTELDKFNNTLAYTAQAAGRTAEDLKPVRKALELLDAAKASAAVRQEIDQLNDRAYELRNTVDGSIDPLKQYALWLQRNGGAARFTEAELKRLQQAFIGLDEAQQRANLEQKTKTVMDALGNITRGQLRVILDAEMYGGRTKGALDELIQTLEDIQGFKLDPGAFNPLLSLLGQLNVKTAEDVGKNAVAIEALIKSIVASAEIDPSKLDSVVDRITTALRNTYLAQSDIAPIQKERNRLDEEFKRLQEEIGIISGTAAERYRNAWQQAINDVAVADQLARESQIASQVRIADQSVVHSDQVRAIVLDHLTQQRSATEIMGDTIIGIYEGVAGSVDGLFSKLTKRLGAIGKIIQDILSGLTRLVLNKLFQALFGGGGQSSGGLFGGGGGGILSSIFGGITRLFGGGAAVAAGGSLAPPAALTGAQISQGLASAGSYGPILPGGLAGGGLFGGAGLASLGAAALPLAVAGIGAYLGRGSTLGTILGIGGMFFTPLLIGAFVLGRNARRRAEEKIRDKAGRDALEQLRDILRRVKTFGSDHMTGEQAIAAAMQVREQYMTMANGLKDGKTKSHAIQDVARLDAIINQIKEAAGRRDAQDKEAERVREHLTPAFATGGSVFERMRTFNGLVPYSRTGRDPYMIRVDGDETVITTTQRDRLGGARAMRAAGVPGYQGGGSVGALSGGSVADGSLVIPDLSADVSIDADGLAKIIIKSSKFKNSITKLVNIRMAYKEIG